jgi:hypothetical protein
MTKIKTILYWELFKIRKRKSLLTLSVVTVIVFPLLAAGFAYLASIDKNVVEGTFVEDLAGIIIAYMSFFIFLPLWVTLGVGQELKGGHASRVAFARGRKHYFLSKLIYCLVVSVLFTILATVGFLLAIKVPVFGPFTTDWAFTARYAVQVFIVAVLYALLMLCLTLAIRAPTPALVAAYCLPSADGIIHMIVEEVWNIELMWGLPFQVVFSLFRKHALGPEVEYINPLADNPLAIVWPILFVAGITYLSYRWFLNRDLKVMSD